MAQKVLPQLPGPSLPCLLLFSSLSFCHTGHLQCSNPPGIVQPQGLCTDCTRCTPHTPCSGRTAQITSSKIGSPPSQLPLAFLGSGTYDAWSLLTCPPCSPPGGQSGGSYTCWGRGWTGDRQGTHRGVGVAVLAAADVDLVLRGLLVHGVVKVDAVDALQPPVLPEEEGPEAQEGKQHCRDR